MTHPINEVNRLYYLDWLRAAVILAAFVGHVALPFAGGRWVVTSESFIPIAAVILVVGNQFVIPTLFLISGAALTFSLGTRTARRFISERVWRLLLPYVIGVLLLSTVQAYFGAVNQGVFQGGFHHYVPQFFSPSRINRLDLSWIGVYGYHLWFLGFLFVFSLLMLPIHYFWQAPQGRRLNEWLVRLCQLRGGILVLGLPIGFLRVILGLYFGDYQGWSDFVMWLCFVVYGYILFSEPRLQAALPRDGGLIAATVLISVAGLLLIAGATLFGVRGQISLGAIASLRGASLVYVLSLLLISLNSWAMVLLVLYSGKRWLNHGGKRWQYVSDASLPFYILHHPIVVALAFYILQVRNSSGVQFVLLLISSFVLTMALYQLVVRSNSWLRRVMGMRSLRAEEYILRHRWLLLARLILIIGLVIFAMLLHIGIQRTADLDTVVEMQRADPD